MMVAQTEQLLRVVRLEHWNDQPSAAARSDFGPWRHRVENGALISYRSDADPACCGQCAHSRAAHRLFHDDGDPEPWSWCDECGGQCEYVTASALRFEGEGR